MPTKLVDGVRPGPGPGPLKCSVRNAELGVGRGRPRTPSAYSPKNVGCNLFAEAHHVFVRSVSFPRPDSTPTDQFTDVRRDQYANVGRFRLRTLLKRFIASLKFSTNRLGRIESKDVQKKLVVTNETSNNGK